MVDEGKSILRGTRRTWRILKFTVVSMYLFASFLVGYAIHFHNASVNVLSYGYGSIFFCVATFVWIRGRKDFGPNAR